MPFEIFRNDDAVEDGAVKVIYVNEKKTTIHNLTPEQWSVSGKTLTFSLPVKPDAGDIIKVALAEEAIFDVCGNPNKEFIADEVSWLFFAPTLDMILGNFDVNYYSAYDETLKNPLGWWEKMSLTTLTPAKASAKKALKAKKTKVTKNTKVKKVRVTKRIRH